MKTQDQHVDIFTDEFWWSEAPTSCGVPSGDNFVGLQSNSLVNISIPLRQISIILILSTFMTSFMHSYLKGMKGINSQDMKISIKLSKENQTMNPMRYLTVNIARMKITTCIHSNLPNENYFFNLVKYYPQYPWKHILQPIKLNYVIKFSLDNTTIFTHKNVHFYMLDNVKIKYPWQTLDYPWIISTIYSDRVNSIISSM